MSEPLRENLYRIWGLMAEYETPEQLLDATRRAHDAGYQKIEAYTPIPLPDLPGAMGLSWTKLPLAVLAGGIIGGLTGYFMQYYSTVIDYPHNIGGRPFHSWPSYVPVTFEMTVLTASLVGLVTMIVLNRLPRPHHPVFNDIRFSRSTRDRFFLCIESRDPLFDLTATRRFLEETQPLSLDEVEDDSMPGDPR